MLKIKKRVDVVPWSILPTKDPAVEVEGAELDMMDLRFIDTFGNRVLAGGRITQQREGEEEDDEERDDSVDFGQKLP